MTLGEGIEREEGRRLSFAQHLDELRARITLCLIVVAVIFVAAWIFRERLLAFLMAPHIATMRAFGLPVKLHVLGYVEAFFTYLKICVVAATFVASPFVLYQIWRFVSVALHPRERRWVTRVMPVSILLFVGGAAFCFFGIFPIGLKFLVLIGGDLLEPMITLASYLSLALWLSFAMGLVFELPLVMFFVSKIGIVTGPGFRGARRVAILIIFIAAAVVTPTPDPFTQCAVALPMIALYEVGILLAEPTRRNLLNVIALFLILAALPVGAYEYHRYQTERAGAFVSGAGQLEYRGASRPLGAGSFIPIKGICRTDANSILAFGLGNEIQVKLHRKTRMALARGDAIDLQEGEAWAHCGKKARLTIMTPHGQFTLQDAEADIAVTEDAAIVTVAQGKVGFSSEGREGTVAAGRRRVFATTGQAVNLPEVSGWARPDAVPARSEPTPPAAERK